MHILLKIDTCDKSKGANIVITTLFALLVHVGREEGNKLTIQYAFYNVHAFC